MENELFNRKLLEKFPEIHDNFITYTSWQDGIQTGSTLIVEDVFDPFCKKADMNKNTETVKRICEFVEECICSNDYLEYNVIYIGFLEWLKSSPVPALVNGLLESSRKAYDELIY